jgi:hypothetical protein
MASLRLFGLPFALLGASELKTTHAICCATDNVVIGPSAHTLFAASRITFLIYSIVLGVYSMGHCIETLLTSRVDRRLGGLAAATSFYQMERPSSLGWIRRSSCIQHSIFLKQCGSGNASNLPRRSAEVDQSGPGE